MRTITSGYSALDAWAYDRVVAPAVGQALDLDEARALWDPLALERAEVGRLLGTCGLMMYGRRPPPR